MMRMRSIALVIMALTFATSAFAASSRIGMGVGATASNVVVVTLDGEKTSFRLADVPAGDERAQAFLQCLVHGRVVRVEKKDAQTHLLLLDDTDVAGAVLEFIASKTTTDPCTLGKAAYAPKNGT